MSDVVIQKTSKGKYRPIVRVKQGRVDQSIPLDECETEDEAKKAVAQYYFDVANAFQRETLNPDVRD